MKQKITLEQWDELIFKQKKTFVGKRKSGGMREREIDIFFSWTEFGNIGEMIEFLGDDLTDMVYNINDTKVDDWCVHYEFNNPKTGAGFCMNYDELCDALWEAVKNKLEI